MPYEHILQPFRELNMYEIGQRWDPGMRWPNIAEVRQIYRSLYYLEYDVTDRNLEDPQSP